MRMQVLDLDGSVTAQRELVEEHRPPVCTLSHWGPSIRLGCRFGRFRRFERALATLLRPATPGQPAVTFCGSGDFHHVSLALVRRLEQPCNLLVLDNHPDWMRRIPFLHCGTWLYHAARLPYVRRVFHLGGEVDFDNAWRRLAPWPLLYRGKIVVFPAVRRFQGGAWDRLLHRPLRPTGDEPVSPERLAELLRPWRPELERWPLYVSLDKDVMVPADAVVNWDSGRLSLTEVTDVLAAFVQAAKGRLAGMDIVGDWSPVVLRGWLRRLLHRTEHPPLAVNPEEAALRNGLTNLQLLRALQEQLSVETVRGRGRSRLSGLRPH
jgi:hypothetical protein